MSLQNFESMFVDTLEDFIVPKPPLKTVLVVFLSMPEVKILIFLT